MATATGRRKQLLTHLDAALDEIERLSLRFRDAIAVLEHATVRDLSVASAAAWFRLFLRLVDLGVELRRGELRHRSTRATTAFPCMHATGARHALHSGLGIDDANAIYQQLERTPGMKESQLERLFMRMDALDRDGVGPSDERLSACLARFVRLPSASYARVDVSGSDPHHELRIYTNANTNAGMTKVTRVCFGAATCQCAPDATPWTTFRLTLGDATGARAVAVASATHANDDVDDAFAQSAINAVATHALDSEEIGLAALKRQYGFQHNADHEEEKEEEEAAAVSKRRRLTSTAPVPISALRARPPQPPRDIYRRKCQERGLTRKRKIDDLLSLTRGALELDLSHVGFHAPLDLQDLLDVIVEAHVPVRLINVTNNFFDAQSYAIFCELLRLSLVRSQLETLHLRCLALPQRADFAALLRILTDAETGGALAQLSTLDLSYNTFFEDAVLSLNDLLNGLPSLATLSLESCFPKAPDPAVVEVAVVKDLVRAALVACSGRLRQLNFGSNWMSFPLLNSLFSPDSALEALVLSQMTFFYFDDSDAAPPLSWKFSFHRQQRIALSETRHSRGEYLPFFVDALTYCLKMRMAQLQHLDLWLISPSDRTTETPLLPAMHLDDRVLSLVQAMAEYGALRTVRLRFDLDIHASARAVLAQLFESGLAQCETLDLALHVPLSLADLEELLGRLNAPQLRSLKLSICLLPTTNDRLQESTFGRVFHTAVASLNDLTLDFQVHLKQSKTLLPDAVVNAMETAWRSLGTPPSPTDPKARHPRQVSLVKRKTKKDRTQGMVTFAFLFTTATHS